MRGSFVAGLAAVLAASAGWTLEVGDVAPPVKLVDQTGATRDVSASYGRWAVLTFYPVDGTAGCTKEAISITATLDKLTAAGIDVYGVSTQDQASKQKFCEAESLRHTLLCDTEKSVSLAYGTLLADRGISGRVTVYIDPTRTVRLIDKAVQVGTHGEDILKTVAALRAEDDKAPLPKLGEPESFGGRLWRLPAEWTRETKTGVTTLTGPGGASLALTTAAGDANRPGVLPEGATKACEDSIALGDQAACRTEWTSGDTFGGWLRWGTADTTYQAVVTGPKAEAGRLRRLLAAMAR